MTFEAGFKTFQIHIICHEENRFLFYGPTRAMVRALCRELVTFFPKPDFSGFLICVRNGSGVSFGQVANLLECIPYYMATLPVYICLDFQASYNFERRKTSTCVSL